MMKGRLKCYNVESAARAAKKPDRSEMGAGTVFCHLKSKQPPALAGSGAGGFEPVD